MLWIAYWLVEGLDTVISREVVGAPAECWKVEVTGERISAFEFEAKTGVATGTKKRIPDTASRASTSPELRFLRYEYLGVFINFQVKSAGNEYIRGMDKLSIFQVLIAQREYFSSPHRRIRSRIQENI